jgi:hypothetical protein
LKENEVDGNDAADYNCPVKINPSTKEAEKWGRCQLDSCVAGKVRV